MNDTLIITHSDCDSIYTPTVYLSDDSNIQIIKTYASLGVTIVGSCLRSHM
jgi:hypothetical protein